MAVFPRDGHQHGYDDCKEELNPNAQSDLQQLLSIQGGHPIYSPATR
ncbi:MAG: hypothetical protein AB7O65_03325 [Candidatus Korobacteraceae bacterium]